MGYDVKMSLKELEQFAELIKIGYTIIDAMSFIYALRTNAE